MPNFTTITLDCNRQTNASPNYLALSGAAGNEIRWSDPDLSLKQTASASWPNVIRPVSGTAAVRYTWMFDADATGTGFISNTTATGASGGDPAVFVNTNYLWARWSWDAVGTFASAPIITSYMTTAHGAITRGNNVAADAILSGNTTDTGATQRSFLKANAFGRVTTGGAPAAAPANAPVVTDGATGAATPTAGANWLTNYQGLQGDNDWIQFPSTPAATTADSWHMIFAMFAGANETPAVFVPVLSLKYTWQ